MAKIAIVNKSDLSIATMYDADAPNQGLYGGSWGRPAECEHIVVPAELDHRCVKAEEGEEGIEIVLDEDKQDAIEAQDWEALRAARNAKLTASDWTQLTDSPLSVEVKGDWATYRQALRDLPENTEDPNDPEWPVEPA